MREITKINGGWYFIKDTDGVPSEIPHGAERVDIPHTWNAEDGTDGGNDYFRGRCLYMRRLELSELPRAEKYYLEFKGVNSVAEVFFNGIRVAEHKGGYSAFRAEIGKYIKEENLIAVSVDNSENSEVYPAMADFTFYGGIYRDVSVISVAKSHFELDCYGAPAIKVTPRVMSENEADVDVEVFVSAEDGARDLSLIYRIYDAEGITVCEARCDLSSRCHTFKIPSPQLWRGKRGAYLYSASVSLMRADEKADEVSTRFGIRSFDVDPERGFILNGRPYPLRGVSRHQDRWGRGNALLPKHHEEDIALILEVGANAVRLAHYQHDSYFYDLCDEHGLVVWAEIPYISKHTENATENAASQLKELILQNYNHPSICFWGLSNEITMGEASAEDITESHKKLNTLAHTLDKTRPTGIACVSMCDINHPYINVPDVVGYNHYFGWYGGSTEMNGPWFDKFHAEHPKIPIAVTEYGCEALDWHTSEPRQGDYTEEYQAYYHEELIKQLFAREYIYATFVWNMFDFGADARCEGGEAGQNHKGLVTFDRRYKKDAFYAYKANLSDEPFVHIAGKRYKNRAENLTRVTVYSNLSEVELLVNGEPAELRESRCGFFKFDVPLQETTRLEARAGVFKDTAVLHRCDRPDESYVLKEKGVVLNWFDVTAPSGYFSLNDEIGEIARSKKGKALLDEIYSKFSDKFNTGMPMSADMMRMLESFSVLRLMNTLSSLAGGISKEELLAINGRLNKIRKENRSRS